ncbi:histidine phosphatase family protein [Endozoicomonadaceae bacterium StTr2]
MTTILPLDSLPAQPIAVLIRHAEGLHNVERFYSSNPSHPNYKPAPLTPKGRQQASDLGVLLKSQYQIKQSDILAVICSPLPRAQQTAELLLSHFYMNKEQIATEPGIIETQLGEREGKNHDQYQEKDFWFPASPESFGAETNEAVTRRMLQVWNQTAAQYQGKSGYVLFISHGSPLFLLIEALEGQGVRFQKAGHKMLPLKPFSTEQEP